MTFTPESANCETLVATAEAALEARQLEDAIARFHAAELAGADPDRCAAGRWSASMLSGEFEAAWRESDGIRGRGAPDPHRFWHGEDLHGQRVIVRCLHGFGDAIQLLRYLPALRMVAASVVLEVAPRLVNVARLLDSADEVITWGDEAPAVPVEWTVQIEVMELPYIFRTQLHDLPMVERYLRVPGVSEQPGNSLQVGIMSTAGSWNPARSVSSACMRSILAVSGCEFWDLNESERSDLIVSPELVLRVDPQCRGSVEGLAARIAALDLVITVDTLAAHVAGALGVPAWVMLQFAADWRWMHGRDDSPWYPSLRLFRQRVPGDWESVQGAVTQALEGLVAMRNAGSRAA